MNRFSWPLATLGLALASCSSKPTADTGPTTPESARQPTVAAQKINGATPPAAQGKGTPKPPADAAETAKQIIRERNQRIDAMFRTVPGGQGGWQKTAVPALAFARQVDDRLAKLSDVSWEYHLFTDQPVGRSESKGNGYVASPTKFRYEFVTFGNTQSSYVGRDTYIADGSRVARMGGKGLSEPVAVASSDRMQTKNLVADWPMRFNEFAFAGIGGKRRPFTEYLSAISKVGSGYKVVAEQKSTVFQGRKFTNERILVTRAKPALNMEFMFDANYKLPVGARVVTTPSAGKTSRLSWGVVWNMNKGQAFDPKLFHIPSGPF